MTPEPEAGPRVLLRPGGLLRLFITVGVLALLAWHVESLSAFGSVLLRADAAAIALAFVIYTLDRLLMAHKWRLLLRPRGFHLSLLDAMKLYCAAMVWGFFLPSTMGADAVRTVCTMRRGINAYETTASIVVERLVGLLATSLLALAGLLSLRGLGPLDPRLGIVWWVAAALGAVAVVAFLAATDDRLFHLLIELLLGRFREHRIVRAMRKFHTVFRSYREQRASLGVFTGLTFLEQLFPIVGTLTVVVGLDVSAPVLYVVAAVPLALLFSRLPVSIGGLGVYEGVFALVVAAGGVSFTEAVAVVIVTRGLQVVSWLPWWIAYVWERGDVHRPRPAIGAE